MCDLCDVCCIRVASARKSLFENLTVHTQQSLELTQYSAKNKDY